MNTLLRVDPREMLFKGQRYQSAHSCRMAALAPPWELVPGPGGMQAGCRPMSVPALAPAMCAKQLQREASAISTGKDTGSWAGTSEGNTGTFQSIFVCLMLPPISPPLSEHSFNIYRISAVCQALGTESAGQESSLAPHLHEFPSPGGEAAHKLASPHIKHSQIRIRAPKGQEGKPGVRNTEGTQ